MSQLEFFDPWDQAIAENVWDDSSTADSSNIVQPGYWTGTPPEKRARL